MRVLGHSVGRGHDRDARAAFHGQQRELSHEVANASFLATADRDHETGARGREPMDVRVVAVLERAARPARPARSAIGLGVEAQQGPGDVVG